MKHFTLVLLAAATLCTPTFAQTRPRTLYTSSTTLNLDVLRTEGQPVNLNRTLFAGYNSICLPMSLSNEQLQEAAEQVQIEKLAAIRQDGNTLKLYFLDCTAEGLEAGTPYLIFSPKFQTLRAQKDKSGGINTQLKSITKSDGVGNQITFGSSWESIQVEGRYGIPAQQETYILESILIKTEADKTFLPTRCGFTWDSQSATAEKLEIVHVTSLNDIETSIEQLQAKEATVDVYNTQGVMVLKQTNINTALQSLPTGIYVINGQKIVVK